MTLSTLALIGLLALSPQEAPPTTPTLQTAAQAFQAQDWAKAVEQYRALTSSQGNQAVVWFRLGYALHALGRYQEAVSAHQKASEFAPVRATALYNLGCAHALLGNKDQALLELTKAVDSGFRTVQQFEQDSDLDSLRDHPRYTALITMLKSRKAPRREFDFWVGSWDVFNAQGQQVGTNVITLRQQGNIIHEAWTSQNGGTGESMNYFDPETATWKQVWVDGGGSVIRYEGRFQAGAMRLMSGVAIGANGARQRSRCTFTPLEDGRVQQLIEHSQDQGKTWTQFFNGFYVRQKAKGKAF